MEAKKRTGGFTLIELIVVIAILGILAGVGTVAYTGYIKAANKGVDKQTVGDLIYAAQLADYADPGLLDANLGMIILTADGTEVTGSNGNFTAALDASVGDTRALKLAYSDWGANIAAISQMLGNITSNKNADGSDADNLGNYLNQTDTSGNKVAVGYSPVANDLWDVVRATAFQVVGGSGDYASDKEADEAAAIFTVYTAKATADYSSVDAMTTAWTSTSTGGILNALERYNAPEGGESDKTLATTVNIAGATGPCVARNMAFAEYLAKYGTYEGVEQDIAKLRDPASSANYLAATSAPASGSDDAYRALANAYLTDEVSNGKSQAYIDGLAYYTFMKSVADQYATEDKLGKTEDGDSTVELPDNFWEDADGYISWASAVGSGHVNIADMQAALNGKTGNAVIIVADKTSGTLKFTVSPADADPRDKNEESVVEEEKAPTEETSSATITIDESGNATISSNVIARKTSSGILTMNKNNSGLVIPEGWTMESITTSVSDSNFVAKGVVTTTNYTVNFNTKNATAGTCATVSITFNMKDSAGDSKTATLSGIKLWAI